MRIAILPQSCSAFHAFSLEERPLGGIETAIIRLAESLHKQGHELLVYTSDLNPPPSTPPYFSLSTTKFIPKVDALIVTREWLPLLNPMPNTLKFFWTGDAPDQVQSIGIGDRRVAASINGFLTVSDWHSQVMHAETGFPLNKLFNIRNGVHLPYFEGSEVRHPKRLIYSSTPFRGLVHLPEIYTELKKRHADLELHVFSGTAAYRSRQNSAYLDHLDQEYAPTFDALKALPGVTVHGHVTQRQLAREFMRSAILCYPNTFAETSCITAMEAQAAGCAIVTSRLAALPETVGSAGILVDGVPGSPAYIKDFIEACDNLLTSSDMWTKLSEAGLSNAKAELSWEHVAARFNNILLSLDKAK